MTIPLLEYESTIVDLPDATARRLAGLAKGAVEVVPDRAPGKWRLTASSKVGSISVDGVRILIRPKIRAENLFLFLEAGLPPDAWRAEAFDYGTTHDLLPAVLSFFARTLETTLATGLLRSYRERNERLVALRGRIDFSTQLARGALAVPVACRYDDFTTDIDENRYLRAALRFALRAPRVPAVDRRRLLRSLAAFEDVADVGVRPDALDRMVSTRLNAHYWPALRLARLLMENLTLVDVRGAHSESAFLIDMNALFERFLTQRLADALRGRLQLHAQAPAHLDRRSQIPLRPDLVLRRDGAAVFIADIKYKLTDDARARREDYYQLLAYTTALDLPEGLLIYCRTPDGAPASTATVVHSGSLLHARAIDASGPPESVAAEVAALAEWLVSRCPRRSR
jgi:5-methylcytosine-specific restriction enzyme subunit McrC